MFPLSPEEREKTLAEMLPFFPEEAPAFEGEYRIEHPWKGSVWVNAWGTVVRRKPSGKPLKIMGCHQDISLRKRALEDLEAQKIKFERLFSENTTAICVKDHADRILQVNPAFENLFGFPEKELRGKPLLTSLVPPELREDFRSYYEEVAAGKHMSRETWRRKKDGSLVEVWLRSIPFTMSSRRMSYDMYLDITLRKRAMENLQRMATTDMLTAIFNRQHFNALARKVLQEAREKKEPLSLILFDIDDFKKVNDTYGHLVGDMVLQKVARGVENFLGKEALFARWGGEEFVLLVFSEGGKAKALAERLRNIVAAEDYSPVPVVTASFGVVEFREYHQGLGSLE
ncbi:MAG TPA: diguanylate cyclase, partial [Synergistaceae bacterium]|nr:diguanylate cyclase [Synergistaceae bacterium]